jgi:alkylation response protein AidB-like acyl-CoA dehydrogenase
MADLIRDRRKTAFALTEREHGSDLLANEFEAIDDGNGFLISGEKWLIGNATRATGIVLLARTNARGGPRGFSLLLVDKRQTDPTAFCHLPGAKTVGLRGSDLSGICFESCPAPASACIGATGSGFEVALKTLQITRTLCTGFSLGAGDTALRLAVDFAVTRRLYGATLFDIPHARCTLANAFIDLMICDCVATSAARALHVCPEQAGVWSAASKYFVPTRIETTMRELSVVMGARFFLRSGHPWSMFQKMARDSSIVSVFEGTTLVQLHTLGLQLEQLVATRAMPEQALASRLKGIFSLTEPLPPFEPGKLDLVSRDGDDAVAGVSLMCDRLNSAGLSETTMKSAIAVSEQYRQLIAETAQAGTLAGRSPERLELARRYVHIHAAACCIGYWLHNREIAGEFFGCEEWLQDCLNRLSHNVGILTNNPARVERELIERHSEGRLFSAIPFQLATKVKNAVNY